MTKRITFQFYNKYFGEDLGSISFPYNRGKAKDGFYTRFWRKWKVGLANLNSVDKHWIRTKIIVTK